MVRSSSCIGVASYTASEVTTMDSNRTVLFIQGGKTVFIHRELMRGGRIAVLQCQSRTVHHTEDTLCTCVTDTVTVEVNGSRATGQIYDSIVC